MIHGASIFRLKAHTVDPYHKGLMLHVWHDNDHMMLFPEAVCDSHHIFFPSKEGDIIFKYSNETQKPKIVQSKIPYKVSIQENGNRSKY